MPTEGERLRALRATQAAELRAEADDLRERAAALERRAEVIERTWGLDTEPSGP